MKVSVYDTHVKSANNTLMHFDILVEENTSKEKVYFYGQEYLKSKNSKAHSLKMSECKFCHIETASTEVEKTINEKGFYIIEMENCN